MSSWLINADKTINRWCKQMGMYCSMATTNGYCQVTACIHMAEPMPICNDENAIMPYKTPKVNCKVDGMIPIEWIRKYINHRTVEFGDMWVFINCMINDWEKENEQTDSV